MPRRRLGPTPAFVAALLLLLFVASGCRPPAPHFSEPNARAHVNRLAGDIGSRPAGTDANRRAREYVVEQLAFLGFTVRVQEADAVRPELGLTARVSNVIAVLPGPRAEAIGLVAHYDSRADTPGAADDGLGVAVALEVARLEAARADRQHSLMVLLTDAEEHGLMGAAAIVEDPEVRSRLQAYLNIEATGSAGPTLLFETGPGNSWIVRRWARAAARPRGGSYQYEIYRRMPNDSDFTLFRRAGIPGLNFAAVGDSYAYHTALDTPDRLTRDVLLQTGETVRATLEALDRGLVTARTAEQPVYFDIAAATAVVVEPLAAAVLGWVTIALAAAAWLRIAAGLGRRSGVAGLLLAAAWAIVGAAAVLAAMTALVWLVRSVSGVHHPWYAHPGRLWLLLVLGAAFAASVVTSLAGMLPARARPPRHPAAVWLVTLPVWLGIAAVVQVQAPAAAYLWVVPLLALTAVVLPAPLAGGRAAQLLAVLVGAVTWTLWLPDTREILAFSVPLLGRLPIVTPVGAFPALLVLAGLVVVPPLAAALASMTRPDALSRSVRRPRALLVGPVLLGVGVLLAFAFAASADPYSAERPLRRTLQYLADHAEGRAVWETGANEPGLDGSPGGREAPGWTHDASPAFAGIPMPRPPHAFVQRAPAALVAAPFTAEGRSAGGADGSAALEITVTPTEPGAMVLFVLPEDAVPLSSSLAGRVRGRHWVASYAAAPAAPVSFRAVLPAGAAARLHEVRAGVFVAGVPGGSGGWHPPDWAGAGPSAWSLRSLHLAAPFAAPARPALR